MTGQKPTVTVEKCRNAQFRLGVLILRIETGRFQRPRQPAEQRLCLICENGEVEDEAHFLLRCEAYSPERQGLFEKLSDPISFQLLPDKGKLQLLLNTPDLVKSTAQFLIDSFDKRSLCV